jgi:hypothetical protein
VTFKTFLDLTRNRLFDRVEARKKKDRGSEIKRTVVADRLRPEPCSRNQPKQPLNLLPVRRGAITARTVGNFVNQRTGQTPGVAEVPSSKLDNSRG